MKVTETLLDRSNRWLAENSEGGSDKQAWEAASVILEATGHDELGLALREILEAAEADDRDARNIVASFGRLHPPQSLGNPKRQRELIGLYLVLRQGGLWDTSDDLGNPVPTEELRAMLE
jgi:hypothetical protein